MSSIKYEGIAVGERVRLLGYNPIRIITIEEIERHKHHFNKYWFTESDGRKWVRRDRLETLKTFSKGKKNKNWEIVKVKKEKPLPINLPSKKVVQVLKSKSSNFAEGGYVSKPTLAPNKNLESLDKAARNVGISMSEISIAFDKLSKAGVKKEKVDTTAEAMEAFSDAIQRIKKLGHYVEITQSRNALEIEGLDQYGYKEYIPGKRQLELKICLNG